MAHQAPNTVTGGSDHLFNKNGDRKDVRRRREFEDGQPASGMEPGRNTLLWALSGALTMSTARIILCRRSVSATGSGTLWTFSWIPSIGWSCP